MPQGLAGLASEHELGFIDEGKGDLVWMQSVDQMEAAFILEIWDMKRLGNPPELSDDQLNCLHLTREKLQSTDHVMWMLVLNQFADTKWVTANIRAPIIINLEARRGVQCIRHDAEYPLRYHWMAQPETQKKAAVMA